MDISKTRAQLVTRAAFKLGIIGSGQSLEDEDQDLIDGVVDATLADLAARDIVTVTDDEAIETTIFEWVADCLAQNVAEDFGKARDLNKTLFAENRLLAITAGRPTHEPLQVDYF